VSEGWGQSLVTVYEHVYAPSHRILTAWELGRIGNYHHGTPERQETMHAFLKGMQSATVLAMVVNPSLQHA
jgi:hypothetical protein